MLKSVGIGPSFIGCGSRFTKVIFNRDMANPPGHVRDMVMYENYRAATGHGDAKSCSSEGRDG